MNSKKRLMLIDAHALAYRAYHAIPPLTSPSGEPTNASFGFMNMLLKAIDDLSPDYIIATFDSGRTFRHDEYEEYKAHRAKMPDDLSPQINHIKKLADALGIPCYTKEGYEADDLLGTLSKQATQEGLETVIVTGDSDALQLVSEDVKVLTPRRSLGDTKLYDVDAVKERYGLTPDQLIDLKALMGDSSDNIPGVRGVGIKTATRLLKEYGSVEAVYEHLNDVKQTRFRSALEDGHESATLSKHLVTIERDVDVDLRLKDSEWGTFDHDKVMELFRELGFHSLTDRVPGKKKSDPGQLPLFESVEAAVVSEKTSERYAVVDSEDDLARLTEELKAAPRFAIDTETTGLDILTADLVGISVSTSSGEAYYIPVGHEERQGEQLPLELVRERLRPVLLNENCKVFHNAKFDIIVLERHGLPVKGPCIDTMIAAWLLNPSGRGIGLKEQVWQRLGIEMTPIEELIKKGQQERTMAQVSIAEAAPYACADADMTLRLAEVLEAKLKEREQWDLFVEMEMPLIPVLVSMERHGVAVDPRALETMSHRIEEQLEQLEEQIHAYAGHPFNVRSTQQLGSVLFEELELPIIRRTKTGYSTAKDVLSDLAEEHPIVNLILEYRKLEKLKSTYIDTLPDLVNPSTGRIHTSYNQTGTSTGRLSSSDPNLQNIPVRTELGRHVRAAFVAPPGHVLLGCDYSQVELRLLAHFSADPEMIAAFHRGEDIHATTAAAIHDIPLSEVTKEQRGLAKTINFGLMYGMSAYGLASRTGLSIDEARQFIETYFQRFSQVETYFEETLAFAREHGYVETIMGRRRYFPMLKATDAGNSRAQRAAERAAINMPIQGSAADILKIAMIRLYDLLRERELAGRLILQIHDELVLEVPEDELARTQELVVDTMENAYTLDVPLKVDAAVGRNWMEMK
ncbi:MAG: DNA polymerase I [Chloroflexota bacterium]|nr:DNA polymerase I [Chloroflexota bacterium]